MAMMMSSAKKRTFSQEFAPEFPEWKVYFDRKRVEMVSTRQEEEEVRILSSTSIVIDNNDGKRKRGRCLAVVDEKCLRSSSKFFDSMLSYTFTVEASTREIVLGDDTTDEGVLAFVSFICFGHPSGFCSVEGDSFDAMEVWLMAHRYEACGVKKCIMEQCIDRDTVLAALHFSCCMDSLPGKVCPSLWMICKSFLQENEVSHDVFTTESLVGVCPEAMKDLLEFIHPWGFSSLEERVTKVFQLVQRWREANPLPLFEGHFIELDAFHLCYYLPSSLYMNDAIKEKSGIFPRKINVEVDFKDINSFLPYLLDEDLKNFQVEGIDPFEDAEALLEAIRQKLNLGKEHTFSNGDCMRVIYEGSCIIPGISLIENGLSYNNKLVKVIGR